jgi:hypothetical protein
MVRDLREIFRSLGRIFFCWQPPCPPEATQDPDEASLRPVSPTPITEEEYEEYRRYWRHSVRCRIVTRIWHESPRIQRGRALHLTGTMFTLSN